MAEHDIHLELPAQTITNADATFKVYSDGRLLGTLGISRGSIDWWPNKAKKARTLEWEQFDRLMEAHARR